MDSVKLQLPDLYFRTPESHLQATVDMDMNAFAEKNPGKVMARVKGAWGVLIYSSSSVMRCQNR